MNLFFIYRVPGVYTESAQSISRRHWGVKSSKGKARCHMRSLAPLKRRKRGKKGATPPILRRKVPALHLFIYLMLINVDRYELCFQELTKIRPNKGVRVSRGCCWVFVSNVPKPLFNYQNHSGDWRTYKCRYRGGGFNKANRAPSASPERAPQSRCCRPGAPRGP